MFLLAFPPRTSKASKQMVRAGHSTVSTVVVAAMVTSMVVALACLEIEGSQPLGFRTKWAGGAV